VGGGEQVRSWGVERSDTGIDTLTSSADADTKEKETKENEHFKIILAHTLAVGKPKPGLAASTEIRWI
jgi:hypothetical protein